MKNAFPKIFFISIVILGTIVIGIFIFKIKNPNLGDELTNSNSKISSSEMVDYKE